MESALDAVKRLRPVFFQYKTDESSAILRSGFIAQEVAEVFPVGSSWIVGQSEGTLSTEDGNVVQPMTVSATELIPHLVRAVQEMAVGVDAIRASVVNEAEVNDTQQETYQGLHASYEALKGDHALLKEDHALLKEDHALLKGDHALLKEDHATLKTKVNTIAEWLRNTQGVVFQ
jgi:hypothetical protein